MNKKLIVGAAVGCAVVCAVAASKNRSAPQGPKQTMWDKMREGMEEMPEDFPPRIMFDNVEATRENSERILELLEKQSGSQSGHPFTDDIEVVPTS